MKKSLTLLLQFDFAHLCRRVSHCYIHQTHPNGNGPIHEQTLCLWKREFFFWVPKISAMDLANHWRYSISWLYILILNGWSVILPSTFLFPTPFPSRALFPPPQKKEHKNICRVHHEKRWSGRSTSWNQDGWEKYQQPQICRWHHPYGIKWRRAKEPLDESEIGE